MESGANDALEFSSPMPGKVKNVDTKEELVEAFRVFDRGIKGSHLIAAEWRFLMPYSLMKRVTNRSVRVDS